MPLRVDKDRQTMCGDNEEAVRIHYVNRPRQVIAALSPERWEAVVPHLTPRTHLLC